MGIVMITGYVVCDGEERLLTDIISETCEIGAAPAELEPR